MKIGGFYKTLKGDVGQVVAAASLNHVLEDDFYFEEKVILCQVVFDNGKSEWWLNSQMIKQQDPQVSLF